MFKSKQLTRKTRSIKFVCCDFGCNRTSDRDNEMLRCDFSLAM